MKMLIRSLLLMVALLAGFSIQAKEWLIDVRTPNEYTVEHIDSAVNIEYQQIVTGAIRLDIQKQDTIRLYCHSGRRAEMAREALLQEGYNHVENLGSLTQAEAWGQSLGLAIIND
jgi:phage shock protein E